jgi:DNA polymerase III subunit beta
MKVICDRAALADAINLVSGAVAVRTPRPQLQCVKITATKEAGAGELILEGTDAEIGVRLSLSQVDVQEPGDVLVPADKLRQIVQAEDTEPTLTLDGNAEGFHIRSSFAHHEILGHPAGEFPAIPEFADVISGSADHAKARAVLTHPAGALAAMVARTSFATAKETSRYAINGVLFKRDGKRLEMVATDGRRLALSRSNLTGSEKDAKPVQCIIPSKALSMLMKLVREHDEPVQIAITDAQILFSFGTAGSPGRAVLTSNLVEGTFPPYDDVIPKDHDIKATFDRDVLASRVKLASVLTNEESRGVRFKFVGGKKPMELSSRAPEMGNSQVSVDLAGYEGGAIEIGFNPSFISDVLKVIDETQVVMELKSPTKPGIIKTGNDFLYVVMPVSLT